MEPFQAVLLGIIQGLTEFLPVSSSGHLVICQHLLGLKEPELFFDISVHMGTLAAVIFFFRRELRSIIISLAKFFVLLLKNKASLASINENSDLKMAFLIVIGSIPTALLGLLFYKVAEQLFSSIFIVGTMLIITGSFLWCTRMVKKDGKNIDRFSTRDALVIGLTQGMAIIPGISRSGSTISMGLFLGLNRKTAAGYSFLLSIPAVLGAGVLSFKDFLSAPSVLSFKMALLGSLTACIVGYFALALLIYLIKHGRLYIFAPYCWLVGIISLIVQTIRWWQ